VIGSFSHRVLQVDQQEMSSGGVDQEVKEIGILLRHPKKESDLLSWEEDFGTEDF